MNARIDPASAGLNRRVPGIYEVISNDSADRA